MWPHERQKEILILFTGAGLHIVMQSRVIGRIGRGPKSEPFYPCTVGLGMLAGDVR